MSRTRSLGLTGCGIGLIALTGLGLYVQRQNDIDRFVAIALAQGAVYLLAMGLVWRSAGSRRALVVILGVAGAMRVAVVLAPPYLSSDIYRYVWDGRVIAAGINPYRYIPSDPHLAALRDAAIFPHINRSTYAHTIYPPAAEAIFFAVTRVGESPTVMKAAMVGFEAIAVALLLLMLVSSGQPASRIIVYAWHPLPLWEFAGSGHIDAAIVAFVALALWSGRRARGTLSRIGWHDPYLPSPPFRGEREGPAPQAWEGEVGRGRRSGIPHLTPTLSAPGGGEGVDDEGRRFGRQSTNVCLAGLALALATLVKFYPAAILPALWRRWDWRKLAVYAAVVVLAYLPFIGVGWGVFGFLPHYAVEEGFTGGGAGFYVWEIARSALPLAGIPDIAYIAGAACLLAGLAVWVAFRRRDAAGDLRGAALIAGTFMLLLSPHYPWYFAWLVVFACLVPSIALVWLTLASFLLYLVPIWPHLVWDRRWLLVDSALYVPFLVIAAAELWRRRKEPATHGERALR